tara:strand:- start:199 stop:594 length:396 start_codon:yes stop_codon:yes gene_type:complete
MPKVEYRLGNIADCELGLKFNMQIRRDGCVWKWLGRKNDKIIEIEMTVTNTLELEKKGESYVWYLKVEHIMYGPERKHYKYLINNGDELEIVDECPKKIMCVKIGTTNNLEIKELLKVCKKYVVCREFTLL